MICPDKSCIVKSKITSVEADHCLLFSSLLVLIQISLLTNFEASPQQLTLPETRMQKCLTSIPETNS